MFNTDSQQTITAESKSQRLFFMFHVKQSKFLNDFSEGVVYNVIVF